MDAKFKLGQSAKITISGETGTVHGLAEYLNFPSRVMLRFKGADGSAKEEWFTYDWLEAA